MLAIFRKEINSFFASTTGYLVIGLFLVLNGLFLWVFEGDFNILDYGYADLTPFFQLVPWIFLFLIPAVTMRSFSDEIKQGTLEILLTKPITIFQLVMGKFLGAFVLILVALLPTLIYIWAIAALGNPVGNLDYGILIGSYLGLLFLAAAYTSMGIFMSSLTTNQITAFIMSLSICFVWYYGLDGLADLLAMHWLGNLSMRQHFDSISRGVIDTRDLVYFISVGALFFYLTMLRTKTKR
ncbi:MAG: gliding motility-associated ABC transporter permease subunit GldF [Cytophagaceae bacterium]|nr:gliding motility-associated ABC transporter permease subunit GldF [Cytophagaceae bacterium]|tara:strand:- start:480 stop:1196 length:717 start_codon:yes stop_codon:yes gene_type:complete